MGISSRVYNTAKRALKASSELVVSKPDLGLHYNPRTSSEGDSPGAKAVTQARAMQQRLFSDAQERRRVQLYKDYDEMDQEVPELNQSIEVYKAFTFGGDEHGDNKVMLEYEDDRARQIIEQTISTTGCMQLLPKILEEGEKRGDCFMQPVFSRVGDVVKLKWLNPYHTKVHWDGYGNVEGYEVGAEHMPAAKQMLYPTDVIHFAPNQRLGNKYGTSTWAAARKLWILESTGLDVMSVLTILRAANRKSVTYPVPANTNDEGVAKWKDALKNGDWIQSVFDSTGKLNRRIVSMLELDDIIYPYRDGSEAPRFHDDPAADLNQLLLVLKHYQERYFVVTGVPAGLAGMERNINARSTLEQQGLHFVRAIKKRQTEIENFLYEFFALTLLARGIQPTKGMFTIRMPRVASFDAKMRAETAKIYAETAVILKGLGLPMNFVLKHALNLPGSLVDELVPDLSVTPDSTDVAKAKEALAKTDLPGRAQLVRDLHDETI